MPHYEDHTLTDAEIEAELHRFAEEEAAKLGIGRKQYSEKMHQDFTAKQRPTTTLLVSGLTLVQDTLIAAALRGLGYKVEPLEIPDNIALNLGKEFGNRAQCNPTYYTVGNLVKKLISLRDDEGLSTQQIIENYVFVTAGACGPCRFGMYVTEYRKALRDSGFEGFRVLLFQQTGGLKQATGEELGLKIDAKFGLALLRAMFAGDVVNMVAYRMRPYEVEPGTTDAAQARCRDMLVKDFEKGGTILPTLVRCRREFARVKVDRTKLKPKVSVIGEFWAMTTEGDGNYELQRFLESEGAEVDIQPLVNWILYIMWEARWDTHERMELKEHDGGRKGLDKVNVQQKLIGLAAAEKVVRMVWQTYAKAIGLHGHHLPDMDEIADLAKQHHDRNVRGGEGHMEVGKLIHFIEDHWNHMTVSVKPFGCMPSSGVSDGVQTIVQARFPESIFLPIETTGDGKVNVQSRIQMMLFKARQKAKAEYEAALAATGMDEETFKKRVEGSRRWRNPFLQPRHRAASVTTNLVYEVG